PSCESRPSRSINRFPGTDVPTNMPSAIIVDLGIRPGTKLPTISCVMVGHYLEVDMTMSSRHPGRQRALIVEDEILIALALEAEVKDLGFDVCGLAANRSEERRV